jgi:hypothetical protein
MKEYIYIVDGTIVFILGITRAQWYPVPKTLDWIIENPEYLSGLPNKQCVRNSLEAWFLSCMGLPIYIDSDDEFVCTIIGKSIYQTNVSLIDF